MTTKSRILETARHLYNTHGVDKVTARHIASEMGISDGNLRYHFKTREDIVFALYLQLVGGMDEVFAFDPQAALDFNQMFHTIHGAFSQMYEYRFLMQDFASLVRQIPKIGQHFRALNEVRKLAFEQVFQGAIEQGWLRKPLYPGEYQELLERMEILSDFWMSAAQIRYQGPAAEMVQHYAQLVLKGMVPYLTPSGLAQFQQQFP
ncbi:TetR/AcrR family transcriptional regulator [Pontibacter sp. G13]|uniref:TetR/AcrR family transcriptional regulator n=1 Tax=Pontibacter sp. G13 TaxID=3074898 RepID=UPI002889B792|nr:TetR/AcrR family transcriptional regulator [Pontibacter sp. G13]WNJ21140.1 TetR/AcrR family transcriptional regulator [Pontibacter sp. G13]